VKTDSLFYRFFAECAGAFFELIGRPATDAERYRFDVIELKDTAVCVDGLYSPSPPDAREPAYFVEFQAQKSERVYSNILLKIALYLEKVNPHQNWHAVVIYPNRSIEQENLYPYRGLLESGQMTRVYLDELPLPPPNNIGLNVLRLLASKPKETIANARALIPQVDASSMPAERRQMVIQLIETVVAYRWPKMSPGEIEAVLKVSDLRHTRVYQDALKEGRVEGREQAALDVAQKMLAKKYSIEKIAEMTGLPAEEIKRLKKKRGK